MKNSYFKILLTLLTINCSLLTVNAQSQFQLAIGTGYAHSIIQTTDSGYAVAGYENLGMYIVKLDGNGTFQWSRTVGGTGDDYALSIIRTTDGGYAMAGFTNSFGAGNGDMYIVKLDASGTLQWSRTVGGNNPDYAYSIIQTTDGGYAVAGRTQSFGAGNQDMYIVKLDGSGTLQWSRTVGGTGEDGASSIIQTTDGGYAVAGYTFSFGAGLNDVYIVKLDGSGTLQWSRTVGGTGYDYASSIIQTTDGGYVMAGYAGSGDFYIVKLDGSGTLQWSRTVGGTGNDFANSFIRTTDGGYAVAGVTNSFGAGGDDMYIVKLDSSGTLQWSRTVGGANYDRASSIIQTTDGGYAVAGWINNFNKYLAKLDGSGNTCGNSSSPPSISGTHGTLGSPTSIVNSPTSIVTSPTSLTNTGGTLTIICTIVGIQPVSNEIPSSFELYQNYPNPFNPVTKIRFALPKSSFAKLVVYDGLGREVAMLVNEQLNPGSYEVDWEASNYPSGVYFYQLTATDPSASLSVIYTNTKKMVLIK